MIVQLIEVLLGLSLIYLIFSTIASAVVEGIEMMLQQRGKLLEQGIKEIITAHVAPTPAASQRSDATPAAPQTTIESHLKTFYASPFISSLFRDAYEPNSNRLPSYIPAERFAAAVLQLADARDPVFVRLRDQLLKEMGTTDAKASVQVDQLKQRAAQYFNESMDRVSGWYQRHARRCLAVVALCLAALCNIDTLQLIRTLSQDEALRAQVVEEAIRDTSESTWDDTTPDPRQQLEAQLALLEPLGLPIGWRTEEACLVFGILCEQDPDNGDVSPSGGTGNGTQPSPTNRPTDAMAATPGTDRPASSGAISARAQGGTTRIFANGAFWSKLLGIALTTLALLFGGPFWFDLLNGLVNLRSSIKPATVSTERSEKAKPAADTQPAEVARAHG